MKKLYELLRLNKVDGLFGIELECEGHDMHVSQLPAWNTTDDGSLRGRYPSERAEFVLRKPLDKAAAIASVKKLFIEQEKYGAKFNFSHRCSVHVHVNVQDMNIVQLLNFFYLGMLFETPLMMYCGPERIGNLFCLRAIDAEYLIDHMRQAFRNRNVPIGHDNLRYSFMNVESLRKYGSLEFRGMKGNKDVEFISRWLDMLASLKKAAMFYQNPRHIHDEFVRKSIPQFALDIFGPKFAHLDYAGFRDDVRKSFSITMDLPFEFVPDVMDNEEEGVVNDGFGAPRVIIIQDEVANAVPVRPRPRQLDELQERMEQRQQEFGRELFQQAPHNPQAPAPEELDL
jgi:hypothetical protein